MLPSRILPNLNVLVTTCMVGLICSSAVRSQPMSSASKPRALLSTSQVTQAAVKFCNAIDQPVSGTPTVTFLGRTTNYYSPCWAVYFPGNVELDIADGSGVICSYSDRAANVGMQSTGVAEPQALALSSFSKAIAASGIRTVDLGAPTVEELELDYPRTQYGHRWRIDACRQYQQIAYFDQIAEVDIVAETGHILSLSLDFPAPQPTNHERTIDATAACHLAAQVLQNARIAGLVLQKTSLSVVERNTFFRHNGDQDPIVGATYIAWDCFYVNTKGSGRDASYDIWIDVSNGSLLGGTQFIGR